MKALMLHSLLENRWFQVSGGFEGPGRAISEGLAVKKVQPKDPIYAPVGGKKRGRICPQKKDLLSVGILKKLWKIMKNYEKWEIINIAFKFYIQIC